MISQARIFATAVLACSAAVAPAQDFHFDSLAGLPSMFAQAGHDDSRYDHGARALDRGDYSAALAAFSEVASRKGPRGDGALYWKAYALNRLGRREEALKALAELHGSYASSQWNNDAGALELEIGQSGGRAISPAAESNDELKLMALNGLMQSDPERALPILDRLLKGNSSQRVKERAIFVLAQSPSPRARQTLTDLAKGQYNPDLQLKALRVLGMAGKDGAATLSSIYSSSSDTRVKSEILKGFMISRATDQLYNAAKNEKNPELRTEAIRLLSASGGHDQLWQLYSAEPSVEIREEILKSLFMTGQPERLAEVLKTEKEPRLRRAAVRSLGLMGPGKTDLLVSMYPNERDPEVRKDMLNALFMSHNAKGLIELARREQDPARKQEIVQKLALVRSKESTDYMLELLK